MAHSRFLLEVCNNTLFLADSHFVLGIQQLATRSLDDARRSFESVLITKPTNLVALLGKVHETRVHRHPL